MKIINKLLSVLAISILLVGCGGGSSTDDTASHSENSFELLLVLVSGSVLKVTEDELLKVARDEIDNLCSGESLLTALYKNVDDIAYCLSVNLMS